MTKAEEEIKEKLLDKKIVAVDSNDFDYSLKLILDDGLSFTIYAQEWLGSPSLGYKSMKIRKLDDGEGGV